MATSPAIGIDLGTTYCCVGVVEKDGKVKIIYNSNGKNITPSYITFTETDVVVGDAAREMYLKYFKNTIYDVKRFIGKRFDDIKDDITHWPFKIIEDESKIKISVTHKGEIKSFFPEQLSGIMLSYLKKIAEDALGVCVKDAVITVPANFYNSQREATKLAAEIAGLNVLRIINEPTAAAIAYDLSKKDSQYIMVYDLGGGTFDVSIMKVVNGNFTVKAVKGDINLGGNDFRTNMVDYIIEEIKKQHGVCVKFDKKIISRITKKCENIKMILSSATQTPFELENVTNDIDFSHTFTRACFNELNRKLFQSTIETVKQCIEDAGLDKLDIKEVVMAGGSSRIPEIKNIIQEFFKPIEIRTRINPDEAVASGAAFLAAQLQKMPGASVAQFRDVTPLSLGIESYNSKYNLTDIMSFVIRRNTPIPATSKRTYYPMSDNQQVMKFCLYEGENDIAKQNHFLDTLTLHNVTAGPKRETKAVVTFKINENGILKVRAIEKKTKNEKRLTITRNRLWTDEEIDHIIKDTQKYLIINR